MSRRIILRRTASVWQGNVTAIHFEELTQSHRIVRCHRSRRPQHALCVPARENGTIQFQIVDCENKRELGSRITHGVSREGSESRTSGCAANHTTHIISPAAEVLPP